MTPVRAVFFDVGGTLVEGAEPGPAERLAAALGLGDDQVHAVANLVLRSVFASPAALARRLQQELGLAVDPTSAVTDVWNAQLGAPDEMPGAAACVGALHAAGAKIAIVANLWEPGAERFRRACAAIVPQVDDWQLSCEAGMTKPNAGIFHAALAAVGVAPADALMVGDSLEEDVGPALALGMGAIWVRRSGPGEVSGGDDVPGVVAVDPHRAPWPVPAEIVPAGALVAKDLSEVRRVALTWLWAKRGAASTLTGRLPAERSPA